MGLFRLRDSASGLEVVRLTDGVGPSRKTSFSNESWTRDDQWIIYVEHPTSGDPPVASWRPPGRARPSRRVRGGRRPSPPACQRPRRGGRNARVG